MIQPNYGLRYSITAEGHRNTFQTLRFANWIKEGKYLFMWGYLHCYHPHSTLSTGLNSKAMPWQKIPKEAIQLSLNHDAFFFLHKTLERSQFLKAERNKGGIVHWNKQVSKNYVIFASVTIGDVRLKCLTALQYKFNLHVAANKVYTIIVDITQLIIKASNR